MLTGNVQSFSASASHDVFSTPFAYSIFKDKYSRDGLETWADTAKRIVDNVCGDLLPSSVTSDLLDLIRERKFIPGGRYIYSAGREYHSISNCFLFRAEDSREGWADALHKSTMCLMSGGGIGFDYSDLRPEGSPIKKTGGLSTGPLALMQMINEAGRYVMQGGSRRSAIWATLDWQHKDILRFIHMKNHSPALQAAKRDDLTFPLPMELTNISVTYDKAFFDAYDAGDEHARHTWRLNCLQAFSTAEPGMSINFKNSRESLRNACCEVVSEDDSDRCNLGTLWLHRYQSIAEFKKAVELATAFLLCGGIYSHYPTERIKEIGKKNNRIGLGLGGMHEWLMFKGSDYEVTTELREWLRVYQDASDDAARKWSPKLGVAEPKGKRSIAPTGCQRGDTLIITEEGILELCELGDPEGPEWQPLELAVGQERGPNQFAPRFYVNGVKATKRLNLKSGCELECTLNHQYRILKNNDYAWVRADRLQLGDKLVVAMGTYAKTSEPDLISIRRVYRTERFNIRTPDKMSPELAWFEGMLLANGSMHEKGIRIACNALQDKWKRVVEVGKRLFNIEPTVEDNGRNCLSVYFNSRGLLRWLYVNGLDKPVSTDMVVPVTIRCSSLASIESFLEGYHFGDGSVTAGTIYIDTVSIRMARQLQTLIRATGYDSSITDHMSGMGSLMHRITWVRTKRRDETKEDTQALETLGLSNCSVDVVVKIEDGECPTFDIEVPSTTTYIANSVVSHNTIGIIAESTTGIEPLFCAAYTRRYFKDKKWHFQYVIDGAVKRLAAAGVPIELIERNDAYSIGFERRVAFQADVNDYTDMAISSTINLPPWGSEDNNLSNYIKKADTLLSYAPRLRGVTCYPDGSRGGQPLTKVSIKRAAQEEGHVYVEEARECVNGVCGV